MTSPFEAVPDEAVPATRTGDHYFGVRLPRSVPFFDCRWDNARPSPVNPHNGARLFASERAELALGNERAGRWFRYSYPSSIGTCYDTAEPRHAAHTADQLRQLRRLLAYEWSRFRCAGRNLAAPGEGGGVVGRPVAVTLANYGASVLADPADSRTYRLST